MEFLQLGIIFVISIGLHEFAHARVSYKLGDPTPKLQNRLTLNPLAHIDPIGFLAIFLLRFGWGKPVQINPNYYKNKIIGEFKVAIAGPITNLILATIGIVLLLIIGKSTGIEANAIFAQRELHPLIGFLTQFSFLNIVLAIFNMIPIPPLDGFTLVKLINLDRAEKILKYQQYIFIGFLIFVLATPGGNFIGYLSGKIFSYMLMIFGNIVY